uniref:Gustatory receptor n=1 Tax=Strigamia maritima TaxID=126957 RepID=T1JKU2_STRMM
MQQVESLVISVDSNDNNNNAFKINRFWKYLYKCYGLQISGDYVTTTPKCYFALFATTHFLINATMAIIMVLEVSDISTNNICLFISFVAYWMQSSVCLIALYKKQHQLSHYLNQLLQTITADYTNRAWKLLLKITLASSALIIITIIGDLLFDYNSIRHNIIRIMWRILTMYYWFVSILNETTKILFIYLCILIKFNFDCLTADVKRSMASSSSLTEQKSLMLNYHYKYYRNIHWINEVNRMFDFVLAAWIVGDVVYVCVMLRFLIEMSTLSFSLIYTIRVLGLLLVMYTYASDVHETALDAAIAITKLTDSQVNNFDYQEFNSTSSQRVNNWSSHLFMHDLSLASVGISVSGYFIVTRGSILTLLGTLLTYAVVVLQTK